MIYNRITAEIGESRRITTRPISYQYDTVQILMLTAAEGVELPEFYQVDFCVIGDEDAVTMVGSLTGGAPIPDSLLRQGENLMAYLVLTGTESDVQTRYEITIPVNERPTRSGIELSDDQQAQVDSLIAALNEGVDQAEAAAESVQNMGVEAETLAAGSEATVEKEVDPETGAVTLTFGIPKGTHGDPGYSPTIQIATITGGHRITVTDSQGSASFDVMDGEQGDPGAPGDDGYSPAVTITQITNGHRVTITDKTHQSGQTFDVMDGEQGDPGTPGDDGYSPAVTITTITGGHRVTITDKTHPSGQTFDVMDGVIQSVNGKSAASITLDSGDIEFDDSETYAAGSIGAEVSAQKNAISALDSDVGDLDDLITTDKSSLVAAINEAAISGGGGITLIVNREDGVTIASGVTVTVTKGTGASAETDTYAYTGQPLTIPFVVDAAYRISVSGAITGFVTPPDAFGTYLGPQLIILTYATVKRYGYRREKTESNCADRITYLFDAVGMTPAGMTYNSSTHLGTFDYGSWEAFCNQIARPVMLNPDGTIKYELDHDNQLYRIDGSPSEVELTAQTANAMTEFGSAFKWVKRYEDEDYEYVIFCNTQYDSDYHAYAHTGDDGNIKDAFYIGMWPGPVASSKLRSIADGSAVSNTITMQVAITDAKAVGTGFNIIYKSAWDYVADLLTLISKTDNSQAAFGNGRQALGSSTNNRGVTSSLRNVGAFYGYNDNSHDVKVFWLVQWWGNIWQWIHGLVNDNGDLKVRMYGPYCDTPVSAADYSTYTSTELDAPQTGGGFQSESHMTDAYGYLWTKTAGSASTYVPDRGNANNDQVSLPIVGATWYDVAGSAGSRTLTVANLASNSTTAVGSRLSYVPV